MVPRCRGAPLPRRDQEIEQRPPLPAARCYHRQGALGKATPRLATCPEAPLAPPHGRPQGPLRPVLVGSTPSTRANAHSAGHHFVSSRHNPAALRSGLASPCRSSRSSRAWSGISRRCNSGRSCPAEAPPPRIGVRQSPVRPARHRPREFAYTGRPRQGAAIRRRLGQALTTAGVLVDPPVGSWVLFVTSTFGRGPRRRSCGGLALSSGHPTQLRLPCQGRAFRSLWGRLGLTRRTKP
jgi:hypothetical protein